MRIAFALATFFIALPAFADAPRVVTDIPPVHSLVTQVMAGVSTPDVLLTQGNDPHSFQLKPSQARTLANADLLFWIGNDLTPWLGRAIESSGIAGRAVSLLADDLDDSTADSDATADADHAPHGSDPHAWLDPETAKIWVETIAGELAQSDPKNADLYAANANATRLRIDQLMIDVEAILAPVKEKHIVVFHDAYDSFANRFGIQIAGSIRQADGFAASAAALSDLRKTAGAADIACVFGEPQHSRSLIDAVVEGTGIPTGTLDPLGTKSPPGADLYDALIRKMATEMAACISH